MTFKKNLILKIFWLETPNYKQESAVVLSYETHGGEDVPIYSSGPMSFLFTGTVEQSYIAHAIAYSACIGAYNTNDCRNNRGFYEKNNSGLCRFQFLIHLPIFFLFSFLWLLFSKHFIIKINK